MMTPDVSEGMVKVWVGSCVYEAYLASAMCLSRLLRSWSFTTSSYCRMYNSLRTSCMYTIKREGH